MCLRRLPCIVKCISLVKGDYLTYLIFQCYPINIEEKTKFMNPQQKRLKRLQLVWRDGSFCCYCGCFLLPSELTIEHYVPKSKGGSNSLSNLKLACKSCNQERGNSDIPPLLKNKPNNQIHGSSYSPPPQKNKSSSLNNSSK